MVPQQWLAHTSVLGVPPTDRRRLDLVVGRDAAMLLDPVGDDIQRGLGARRAGDDVQVVQKRQKLLARLEVSRRLLQALVLTEGEQRGGRGVALLAALRLVNVAARPRIIPPAVR